uniref:Uncharacterized protein n=1 Tax=Arundo donax TaxID=35708 RepID=A0A0A8ZQP3_ARUDO
MHQELQREFATQLFLVEQLCT